ncbi:TIGR04149 family rSAM-modified RiPP [Candidatus Omnitrophota bacterium]
MRQLKLFTILLFSIAFLLPHMKGDSPPLANKTNQNLTIISTQEMSDIIGGCGGTCKNYVHSCDSLCTHFNADKCNGTTGNCINDNDVLICDCPAYYDFTFGCIK